uniref:Glycosyltransferase 2-like domain-containing protein n=1 Tax=Araucaria cunninghamii TaxID=56994 RepID=A0A0D6QW26_ARACU
MDNAMNAYNPPLPLYEKVIHRSHLYKTYVCLRLILFLCFLGYRVLNPMDELYGFWILAFACELWFAFDWILYQNMRWTLIDYKTYPERIASRYGGESASKLPPVDIIITTTDPYMEPAILTANTVLSVLAIDYPVDKFACYVSDDGASPITFYSLVEILDFAKKWVPFCRKYNIESRAALLYFSKETKPSDPDFLQEWLYIRDEYESLEGRITKALETGHVPLDSVSTIDGFVKRNSDVSNHSTIVKVIHENKGCQGDEGGVLPHLIYVAREKRPKFDHHYKAGAMNVMARVSGVMTNAPFILNLDCDMHVSNPKAIQEAMCFFLDCPSERECGFVQFPQLFYDVLKDDPFGSQIKFFFAILAKGLNGIQGPLYAGTCCFHRRKELYGVPPSEDREEENGTVGKGKYFEDKALRKAFGESSALVASGQAIMRDGACHMTSSPPLSTEEALKVASSSYEANTAWGKEVGWMYGSTVEDVMTGLKVHSLGWRSIYYRPQQPSFMGRAPDSGPDSLVQQKRWATGLLEICFSRLSPFLGKKRKLIMRQRMVYASIVLSPLYSVAALCYSLLPAFCLLSGTSFLPKIHEPAFYIAVALLLSVYGFGISEYLLNGWSVREWWNNQRMWFISNLSFCLFATFDVVMKSIGFSQTVFVVTPKGSADDDMGNKSDFTFNSSPLFISPTTVLLVNMAAIVYNTLGLVGGEYELRDKAFAELLCCVGVVMHLSPFLKGLVRRSNRGLPWNIVIKSSALAFLICRTCV